MDMTRTRESIAAHCARYPALQPTDLMKFLHQSVFGCGHLIADPSAAADWVAREAGHCAQSGIEPLSGDFCRVHLGTLQELNVTPRSFAQLFALSARKEGGTIAQLEEHLDAALDMAREGLLSFSHDELRQAVEIWRDAGYEARHHSPAFRTAYAPAYRVLHRSHAALLPLLGLIDRKLAQSRPVVLAIDGGAGSGKSTLAAVLEKIYDGTVLHMDDFFLRPEQRTPERYATPGGNIDHERFSAEVLPFLRRGEPFLYRPFDCATFTVQPGHTVTPKALTVVEGSYSLHPALGRYYDAAVFLTVDAAEQRRRIEARNPDFAPRFFRQWIPLEEAYFAALDPAAKADLVMEVSL